MSQVLAVTPAILGELGYRVGRSRLSGGWPPGRGLADEAEVVPSVRGDQDPVEVGCQWLGKRGELGRERAIKVRPGGDAPLHGHPARSSDRQSACLGPCPTWSA